jgi:hypothetical protein
MITCYFSVAIVCWYHGHFRRHAVQHAVLLEDLLRVLFLRETDGPRFSVCDNVHPEDKLGLTKVCHAELFPNAITLR